MIANIDSNRTRRSLTRSAGLLCIAAALVLTMVAFPAEVAAKSSAGASVATGADQSVKAAPVFRLASFMFNVWIAPHISVGDTNTATAPMGTFPGIIDEPQPPAVTGPAQQSTKFETENRN